MNHLNRQRFLLLRSAGIFLLGMIFLCSFRPQAQQEYTASNENTLRSLFIYNFTKHIEWPGSRLVTTRFNIGVYGSPELTEKILKVTKGRTVFDKMIDVKNVTDSTDFGGLHILYVVRTNTLKIEKIVQQYGESGLLIITEEKGMLEKGVGINMIQKHDNLRFELNEEALRKAGLKVSNQLINLAQSSR